MGHHESFQNKYVYCIISVDEFLNGYGNDSSHHLGEIGINNGPIFSIHVNDIAAIVSEISNKDIQLIRSAIRSGKHEGLSYFISHQNVVEACRKAYQSVLPVRFGSILTDIGVQKLLLKEYNSFRTKLMRFRDKEEYRVRLLLGPKSDQMIAQVIERLPEVERLKNTIGSDVTNAGSSYFTKLRLSDFVRSKRFRIIENAAADIHRQLSTVSDSAAALGKDTSNTIFNRAFLVDKRRAQEFSENVESMRRQSNPLGLLVHASGPWAPYSFCTDSVPFSEPVSAKIRNDTRRPAKRYRLIKKNRGATS